MEESSSEIVFTQTVKVITQAHQSKAFNFRQLDGGRGVYFKYWSHYIQKIFIFSASSSRNKSFLIFISNTTYFSPFVFISNIIYFYNLCLPTPHSETVALFFISMKFPQTFNWPVNERHSISSLSVFRKYSFLKTTSFNFSNSELKTVIFQCLSDILTHPLVEVNEQFYYLYHWICPPFLTFRVHPIIRRSKL